MLQEVAPSHGGEFTRHYPHPGAVSKGPKPLSDLGVLEQRIDELIEAVRTLSTENRALRAQRQSLTAERAKLLERNERASSQVDSMIGRLKALEEAS